MKQEMTINVETIEVKGIRLGGINVSAKCEYEENEMRAEGDVAAQIIDTLTDRFGWFFELAKRGFEIDLHNKELLSQSLEDQIKSGKCEAYGPHGWSVKSTTTTTEDYDPNKSYAPTTTTKKHH